MKLEIKSWEEIESFIGKEVFVFSCNSCGREDIDRKNIKIKEFLEAHGIKILGIINLEPKYCNINSLRKILEENFISSNFVLTFTCGGLPQVLPSLINSKVIPAVNTLKIELERKLGSFARLCSACGECWIHYVGNLCIEKLCPKKMRNGPCGGAKDGYCEVFKERICPFIILFKKKGEIKDIIPPKNFSKILLQE
ncbi:MAG: methylenetetrahydrofolate reductase C-terminal domain-containing protein [Dictyoglomaceae bacterium]